MNAEGVLNVLFFDDYLYTKCFRYPNVEGIQLRIWEFLNSDCK